MLETFSACRHLRGKCCAYLLKLQLHRRRIQLGNCVRDVVAYPESLVLRSSRKVDKQGIGVAINDLGIPFPR